MIILIIACLVVTFIFLFTPSIEKSKNDAINAWSKENMYTVINIEQRVINTGPYFDVLDSQEVYRVEIKNKDNEIKYFYFRFGLIIDIEEYDK